MQSATRRIDRLQDPDDRDRFRRHERIVRRTQCLFAAEYDPVREELKEEPQGDPTNSPYRRWLHQRVLLALDTEDPANWVDESDWVSRVSQLTAALERIERRKFGLPEQADLDAELAYKWWPTWRSTLALVLATRGEDRDRERALKLIENLASPTNTPADHENPLFGGILQHEYYVQVLALITLAIERLHALEATRGPTPGGSWDGTRRSWAGALNRRLDPFAAQAVVPGSAVMNLGSVYSFLAMLFACEENWEGYVGMFEKGCKRNKELRGRAAVVRTLVTHAEMEGLRGSSRSEGVAREAREMAAKLKMIPWARRAEALM